MNLNEDDDDEYDDDIGDDTEDARCLLRMEEKDSTWCPPYLEL